LDFGKTEIFLQKGLDCGNWQTDLICPSGKISEAPRHCEEPTGRANARLMTGYATKQSSFRCAAMDCFVEFIIGRRFAPTRWLAMTAAQSSKRLLLVAALLADEFHPGCAFFRRDPIRRAAFTAHRLDAGIALLHHQRFTFHGFADQALGLLAHRLLRHQLLPVHKITTEATL
jgi:hypothetical protein